MSAMTNEWFTSEALAADIRELAAEIEAHHVDPYIGYDGRVALHATAARIIQDLPDSEISLEEAWQEIAPLVAGLQDAHSRLHPVNTDKGDVGARETFPLSLRVIGTGLFVTSVSDERVEPFVGCRLVGVEDVPTETLKEQLKQYDSAENNYTALTNLARRLTDPVYAARLLDRDKPQAELSVRFETDAGDETVMVQAQIDSEPVASTEPSVAQPNGIGPRYQLYNDGNAAVFVPGNLQSYRECLECAVMRGGDLTERMVERAYKLHVGDNRPADVDAAVAALPSMMETIHDATAAMAASNTETLIVDLRDNPGGDSRYVKYLAHALFGRDGLTTTTDAVTTVRRQTDAHRARFGDNSETVSMASGGYDLSEYLSVQTEDPAAAEPEQLVKAKTAAELLEEGRETVYEPSQVIVAVSASTMSAGFAGAAQLSTLGADIVGVPPGQAPISFGEPVERSLSNTGLTASLSSTLFEWVPEPDGEVLDVDAKLTPALYKQYSCAGDAGLRLAFEHAGIGSDPPEPVE